MRGTEVKRVWAFLLTILLALGAAVAILPGCADDDRGDYDSEEDRPPTQPE